MDTKGLIILYSFVAVIVVSPIVGAGYLISKSEPEPEPEPPTIEQLLEYSSRAQSKGPSDPALEDICNALQDAVYSSDESVNSEASDVWFDYCND